jgi:hypothetical protein
MVSTPRPLVRPQPIDACIRFPQSLIGGFSRGAQPTLLPGRWLSEPLSAEELAALADQIETGFRAGDRQSPDRADAAVGELHAATLRNLRSGLAIAELSRRQLSDYRLALRALRTSLANPRRYISDRRWDRALLAIGLTTWLLTFKAGQAERRQTVESLVDQTEPLTELVGISLVDAVEHFANPSYRPSFHEPALAFVRGELGRPGDAPQEAMVTRALAYTLDQLRGGPASSTTLYRLLDSAVESYFTRQPTPPPWSPAVRSSRPLAETQRLLSNALFVELRRGGQPISADFDRQSTEGDPCRTR